MVVEFKFDLGEIEMFAAKMMRLPGAMAMRVHTALNELATEIKEEARRIVPVRTGFLKSTIYSRMGPFAEFGMGVRRWQGEVGAWAPYAKYVEFGTRYMKARPYLLPSVAKVMPKIARVMQFAMELAIKETG